MEPHPGGNVSTDVSATNVTVAVIAPDDSRRQAFVRTISETPARIVEEFREYPGSDAVSKLIAEGCDVIIVDLDGGVEPGLARVATISRRDPSVTVMAASSRNDADVVIRAMQAGAREFLTAPLAASTLIEAFARAAARRHVGGQEKTSGKVLVFQGAKGGTGVTTLAINFAAALVEENAGKVVLVDVHPQLGEIALGLGIVPKFSIADALENAGRLDADFLSTLLTKHESGLMVLASVDIYGTHRSMERGADKLFRILREEFAFVVVDAGSCSGNIPNALFDLTNTMYLVTEVNLPALRNARRLITHFGTEERALEVEIVLNRFNSRAVEIDEESIVKALSRTVDWKVPNDYMAVRGAQNLGIPLIRHDTPISRVARQMAKAAAGKSVSARSQNAAAAVKGDKWKFWTSKAIRPLSTARS